MGRLPLDPALVGQWVSAGPRQLAVGEGQLASFGERDERGEPRGFIPAQAGLVELRSQIIHRK